MADKQDKLTRRDLLKGAAWGASLIGMGGVAALAARGGDEDDMVWQIDPYKCTQCGNCESYCVLSPSAVKCVHVFPICGYCKICFGYYDPRAKVYDTDPAHQLCPTGAISRTHVEGPYYEYHIDEDLCIGCGKCVKGCATFGNASLILQVRHNLCVNCNECAIAAACPSEAFRRVPASRPYLFKTKEDRI